MLKGTLEHFALADIFRLLSWAKKTGKLEVVRSAGRGKIFFRSGEVYYAESSLSREPLGQKLIRSGALTEGQLMKALDQNAQTGDRVGQILVANGWVAEEQLQGALRQQIEDAVFDLLRWELGEFDFQPQVEADIEVQIAVSVENLIIEASRRLDELEVIERKIPSETAVVKMSNKPPEGAAEINITPEEWRMLVLVDGRRTVHDIALLVGIDDFGALRGLYGLVSAGLVEVVAGDADAPQGGGEAVSAFEGEVPPPPGALQPRTEPAPAGPVDDASASSEAVQQSVESETEPEQQLAGPSSEPDVDQQEIQSAVIPEPEVTPEPAAMPAESVAHEPEHVVTPAADPEPSVVLPESDSVFQTETSQTWDAETLSSVFHVEEPAPAGPTMNDETEAHAIAQAEPEEPQPEEPQPAAEQPVADAAVEAFDAPAPGEVQTSKPDPFLNDLLADQPVTADPVPEAPLQQTADLSGSPVPPAPSPAMPQVDRSTVVRELAGLFSEDERPQPRPAAPPSADAPDADADHRKRVEDDDQLNKGLISRLIDGVKGL